MKLCAEELFVALKNKVINVVAVDSTPTTHAGGGGALGSDTMSIVDAMRKEKKDLSQVAVPCPKLRAQKGSAETEAGVADTCERGHWNELVQKYLIRADDKRARMLKMRCEVFHDMHRQGYHLTSGIKFGSHYLAYPGDPMIFHAQFMVYVVDEFEALCPLHIAATARYVSRFGLLPT